MRFAVTGIFVLLASVSTAAISLGDDASVQFGNLELRDCYGKVHSLPKTGESKVIVVAFLGTECPLAKLYGPKLQAMSAALENQGVRFIGVCSNVFCKRGHSTLTDK